MINVVIVEDHPLFRDGLRAALAESPDVEVTHAVGSLAEARPVVAAADVVLLDLGLPDGSGLDLLSSLRHAPRPAVIVLTMNDDRATVLTAVRAGARGYLLKGAGRAEITDAVRRAAQGGISFDAGPSEVLLAAASGPESDPVAALGLTPREGDVLRLLAAGLTNEAIARRLGVAQKTVRNQVSAVFTKLGVDNRAAAAERADRAGL
jgi:DNA-binding NarL/FixJ family response regulator